MEVGLIASLIEVLAAWSGLIALRWDGVVDRNLVDCGPSNRWIFGIAGLAGAEGEAEQKGSGQAREAHVPSPT
jgi:hypothetical protein